MNYNEPKLHKNKTQHANKVDPLGSQNRQKLVKCF